MSTVAVIPARGGSKGIPRKNMRLMHGKPLIEYAITNALECRFISTVVVSSDSQEIIDFASQFEKVIAVERSSELSHDSVTLDPVIYDAVVRAEELTNVSFDNVVTLQPTSPLLTVKTLNEALERFNAGAVDSMISVVNSPHLSWKKDALGNTVPDYYERLNRQQLPPHYIETGAFLITKRECLTPNSRLGNVITVYEVPADESVDIDTKQDWAICENALSSKHIVFRVDGHKDLGLGHVYRALTLAYSLIAHEVSFVCNSKYKEGIAFLRNANMNVVEIANDDEFFHWLELSLPDVLVYDCLDSDFDFITQCKKYANRVVTFEDLGTGVSAADAVVNALYEGASPYGNVYTGKKYVCLRDEFLIAKPSNYSEQVKRILVTFGGTDPLDLTDRLLGIARQYRAVNKSVSFEFVMGPGYKGRAVNALSEDGIVLSRDIVRMSDHMREADLAFSSQGRTTYELAAMGVPTIVLAQNSRELLHSFAQMSNGFINLGLGSAVSNEDIATTMNWICSANTVRYEMHQRMLSNNLRAGISRVKAIILGDLS